jgi:hypothetical protein
MRTFGLACFALVFALSAGGGCGKPESIIDDGKGGGSASGGSATSTGNGGSGPCTPMASEPCYTGPAGTQGVGICVAGTRTCSADGTGFGPCLDEVVPKPEDCSTPEDDDCDGKAPPCTSDNLWSKRFGPAEGLGIAVGSDGNPVLVGRFSGSINFGGNNMNSSGGYDAFVVKLDGASGEHLWSRRLGGNEDEAAWSVAVDTMGDVVVIGEFLGQMSVGDGSTLQSAGGNDVFVAKYDGQDGSLLWSKRFGDAADQLGRGVAVDGMRNVWITGSFTGSVDFGAGALTSAGNFDVFVAKLDSQGSALSASRFGDSDEQDGRAIAIDVSGGAAITGDFRGSMDMGVGVISSQGGFDVFAARLDASGKVVYAKGYGNNQPQRGYAVATTAGGDAVFTGIIRGKVDFGGGALSAGNLDVFLLELTPTGQHVKSRLMGGTKADNAGGVAIGASGRVVVGGGFQGSADFGGQTVTSKGGYDAFLARYEASGALATAKAFGDDQDQNIVAVATDAAGHVFVLAQAGGAIDFGTGTLWCGENDLAVAKLAP